MQIKDPWWLFLSCFGISSFAGLAQLLRSGQPLTFRSVASALLYSGMSGLIVGLLWYNYFSGSDNLYFLLGISGLAGIGSASVIDFLTQLIAGQVGVNIRVSKGDEEKK
jgi:hypothetical protein